MVDMEQKTLSEVERRALSDLIAGGGALLVTAIPDKNEKELVFGGVKPGHTVYRRLEKAGLCFYSEPVVADDGFEFTGEVYLTDEGRSAVAKGQ